jgi:hypothetical protein
VASNGTTDLTITQGASNVAYAKISILSTQLGTASLFEGTTVSGDGTVVTSYNRNRSTAGSPSSTVHHTPTVSTTGTEVLPTFVLPALMTGYVEIAGSWLLKANTKYLVRYTNAGGSAASVGILVEWYES